MSSGGVDDATPSGKKAWGNPDAWDARAEVYVSCMIDGQDESKIRLEMPVGREIIVNRVHEALKDKEKPVVLDVASGGGEPSLSIAKACPHAEVFGTDFAPKMVDFIRKRAEEAGVSNVKSAVENAVKLEGFDDASVDVVTCTWGLESVPDPRSALQQFHRVLRDGGITMFAVWENAENTFMMKFANVLQELTGATVDTEILPLGKGGGAAAKKELEEIGFRDIKVSKVKIPVLAPSGTGYHELFDFFAKGNPIEVALVKMEESGRSNVREDARAIFEATMKKNKEAEDKAPPDPGSAAGVEPAHNESEPMVLVEALIIEGYKGNQG